MAILHESVFSLASLSSAFLLYLLLTAIYRLYLHPLSRIPGPRLAALTVYYEAYFNVFAGGGGQFLFELGRLHRRHGPVVRIGPNELHVNDPACYDLLYTQYGRWDKAPAFVNQFDNTDSAFGTVPHELHRLRRRAFQAFFSRQRILAVEPRIAAVVAKLCARLETYRAPARIVPLRDALECLTNDVVMDVAFARNEENVAKENFNPELHATIKTVGQSGHYMKLVPGVQWVLPWVPPWMIVALVPAMKGVVELQESCKRLAQKITSLPPPPPPPPSDDPLVPLDSHPTVCHTIYSSPDLPLREKSARRLQHEIETFVIAGTETTAHALAVTVFHVLDNPAVARRLKRELRERERERERGASTDVDDNRHAPRLDLRALEQLPYLTAVLLEGLRLSYGVAARLPRVAPDRSLKVAGWDVPAGTPISMSTPLIHHNADLFPEPLRYDPERWLGSQKRGRLEKYLVNFSRGTRGCVGVSLAWAELYLTIGALFSRFELELAGTGREDVDICRENFTPQARKGSKGVRVWVR